MTPVTEVPRFFLVLFSQSKGVVLKKIQSVIEQDGEMIAREAEKLQDALTHFRYEGKLQRGKNLKAITSIVSSLDQELKKHKRYQEKILFPFLKRHVPKYEPTIHFFQSDHEAIWENTQKVKESLKQIRRSDLHPAKGSLRETGIYLVCLLRHHVRLEKNGIQKILEKDLKEGERAEIKTKVQKWFDRYREKSRPKNSHRGKGG